MQVLPLGQGPGCSVWLTAVTLQTLLTLWHSAGLFNGPRLTSVASSETCCGLWASRRWAVCCSTARVVQQQWMFAALRSSVELINHGYCAHIILRCCVRVGGCGCLEGEGGRGDMWAPAASLRLGVSCDARAWLRLLLRLPRWGPAQHHMLCCVVYSLVMLPLRWGMLARWTRWRRAC